MMHVNFHHLHTEAFSVCYTNLEHQCLVNKYIVNWYYRRRHSIHIISFQNWIHRA